MASEELLSALSRASLRLIEHSRGNVEDIEVLIESGELLVAFEILVTQLYEYNVQIEMIMIAELKRIGGEVGASQHYLEIVEKIAVVPGPSARIERFS